MDVRTLLICLNACILIYFEGEFRKPRLNTCKYVNIVWVCVQSPTSVRDVKAYGFISMDNIQLI